MPPSNSESTSNEVLMVKLNHLIESVDSLRLELKESNATLQKIPVFEEKLTSLDGKMTRAFKSVADVEAKNVLNSEAISNTRFAFRILSGASTFAFAMIMAFSGWAWGQLDGLKKRDEALADRIKTIEVQTEAVEKLNDKMTNGGWVRGK